MKPIIGIIGREVSSDEGYKMYGVYQDIISSVYNSGGIPICILNINRNFEECLRLCNGLIFQGGDEFTDYEKKYMRYAHKKNIPTLGICLGMQLMGTLFDGKFIDVDNHKVKDKNYVHKVILNKKSKLYKIVGNDVLKVNSRHKSAIIDTKLDVVGVSEDGVVEAIEDKSKNFFIGIQWHPENLVKDDKVSRKLFKEFINICKV